MYQRSKGQGKSGGKEESGQGATKACKYFTSEGGCKKGKQCSYAHEWGDLLTSMGDVGTVDNFSIEGRIVLYVKAPKSQK